MIENINKKNYNISKKGEKVDTNNKIYELRKKHNYSQEQLAEKLDVTRQTISKWELNATSPDINQSKKIIRNI